MRKIIVIGAGPAGVDAIAKLLQAKTRPSILWIAPAFDGGDFANKWKDVPGNTKASAYLPVFRMLETAMRPFLVAVKEEDMLLPYLAALNCLELLKEACCSLGQAAEPLRIAIKLLARIVDMKTASVTSMQNTGLAWAVHCSDGAIHLADQVIIAIGAEPKKYPLPIPQGLQEIVLEDALSSTTQEKLRAMNIRQAAVIGSSHSAALAVMQLIKAGVPVWLFKKQAGEDFRYAEEAVSTDAAGNVVKQTYYDNTGLKGDVARWMKSVFKQPELFPLRVIEAEEEQLKHFLPQCSHFVFAGGFAARDILIDKGEGSCIPSSTITYDPDSGVAKDCPNLMFHGLCGPTYVIDKGPMQPDGSQEKLRAQAVGLTKFFKVPVSPVESLATSYDCLPSHHLTA